MRLRHGCTQDAEKLPLSISPPLLIAWISFPKKEQGRLLSLLTKSFTLTYCGVDRLS